MANEQSGALVREGFKLQELFEKDEGKILVKVMETLYAETLAEMLDPAKTEKEMSEGRTRCHVILDFAEKIGMRLTQVAIIQQRMAKQHIREEMQVNPRTEEAMTPRGGVY